MSKRAQAIAKARKARHAQNADSKVADPTPAKAKALQPVSGQMKPVSAPSKAQAFANDAEAAGWAVERKRDGDCKTVIASRGSETIEITWIKNVYQPGSVYSNGSGSRKLRNASDARKVLAVAESDVKHQQKVFRKTGRVYRETVPFDADTASDDEILASISGRMVRWTNQFTDTVEEARVPKESRFTKISITKDGDRQVMFCEEGRNGSGFRAFSIASLIGVG